MLTGFNLALVLKKTPDTKQATETGQAMPTTPLEDTSSGFYSPVDAAAKAASKTSIEVHPDVHLNHESHERLSGRESPSTEAHFHSTSNPYCWSGTTSHCQGIDRLRASIDIAEKRLCGVESCSLDKLAEEWHQQLQSVHPSSPARKATSLSSRQNHQPPLFQDSPQGQSTMQDWPDSLGLLDRGSTLRETWDTELENGPTIRRHTLSLQDQRQSNNVWWVEPEKIEKLEGEAHVENGSSFEALAPIVKDSAPLVHVDANAKTLVMQDNTANQLDLGPSSGGIEKTIFSGLKKVIHRKQDPIPLLPPNKPDTSTPLAAATSHQNINASGPLTPSRSVPSVTNTKENNQGPENVTPPPKSEVQIIDIDHDRVQPPKTPSKNDQGELGDIDSIIRVLIAAETKEPTVHETPEKCVITGEPKDMVVLKATETAASPTIPSTPIANAYAEVRAYISSALGFERPDRHESPSSSYDDAISQRADSAADGNTQTGLQAGHQTRDQFMAAVPAHKSLESIFYTKSEAVSVKNKPAVDPAATRYMTWNGRTKAKEALMGSTVQFSAEIDHIFRDQKENARVFESHTSRPRPVLSGYE